MRPIIPFLNFLACLALGTVLVIYANRSPDTMTSDSDMSDSDKVACVSSGDLLSLAPIGGCSGTKNGCCPGTTIEKNEDGSNCAKVCEAKCIVDNSCGKLLKVDKGSCIQDCKKQCDIVGKSVENFSHSSSGPSALSKLSSSIKDNDQDIQNVKNVSMISGSLLLVMAFVFLIYLIYCLRHNSQ